MKCNVICAGGEQNKIDQSRVNKSGIKQNTGKQSGGEEELR